MKRNRPWKYIPLFTAGYLLLLFLLVKVESQADQGVIHTYADGFWYTLTTLTTVGYGDLYPVTGTGRIIGVIFQLFSLGLLAVLVGTAVLLFKGVILPWIRLRTHPRDAWYIFVNDSPESEYLASRLSEQDPHSVILFTKNDADSSLIPEQILQARRDNRKTVLFCTGDSDAGNLYTASRFRDTQALICCESSYEPDMLSEREILFDPYSLCARLYWQKYPVTAKDEKIRLIGSGKYAEAMLEYALIQNVIDPDQQITYTVCGDFGNFRRNHPSLSEICGTDRIYFTDEAWNQQLTALAETDRVIFCDDDREVNLDRVTQLLKYTPVNGTVYAITDIQVPGSVSFGTLEEIWTPELVMRTKLNQTAMRLHEIYRRESGNKAKPWQELSSFTRRSNLASADHLPVKIRILLHDETIREPDKKTYAKAYEAFLQADENTRRKYEEIEHIRWMRFHLMNGWQYAPVRNDQLRRHPLLCPFNDLSAEEQAKDDYGWKLLGTLAEDHQ
ncbi:MAG: hypothetical protein IJJ29_02125 [Solobacterium sp.]|nr:hypothetical protein [Solobacterium sp.]